MKNSLKYYKITPSLGQLKKRIISCLIILLCVFEISYSQTITIEGIFKPYLFVEHNKKTDPSGMILFYKTKKKNFIFKKKKRKASMLLFPGPVYSPDEYPDRSKVNNLTNDSLAPTDFFFQFGWYIRDIYSSNIKETSSTYFIGRFIVEINEGELPIEVVRGDKNLNKKYNGKIYTIKYCIYFKPMVTLFKE